MPIKPKKMSLEGELEESLEFSSPPQPIDLPVLTQRRSSLRNSLGGRASLTQQDTPPSQEDSPSNVQGLTIVEEEESISRDPKSNARRKPMPQGKKLLDDDNGSGPASKGKASGARSPRGRPGQAKGRDDKEQQAASAEQEAKMERFMEARRVSAANFLSKYCVVTSEQLSLYKNVHQSVDKDKDGLLTPSETMRGLRELNDFKLSDREMEFVISLLESLDSFQAGDGGSLLSDFDDALKLPSRAPSPPPLAGGEANSLGPFLSDETPSLSRSFRGRTSKTGTLPFKVFALLAAFSERVTGLEPPVKERLNRMNISEVRAKLAKCRLLFKNTHSHGKEVDSIELKDLEIEMYAGGLSEDEAEFLLDHMQRKQHYDELSFLDYLAYMPLWLGIHDAIVDNPLHPQLALSKIIKLKNV